MPTETPATHQEPNGQWDVVTTIKELESLQAKTQRCIEHTIEKMGIRHGIAPDGTEIVEHPLGMCMGAIGEALRTCHAKYGRDMLQNARMMDGTFVVHDPKE